MRLLAVLFLLPLLFAYASSAADADDPPSLRRRRRNNEARIVGGQLVSSNNQYPYFGFWERGCGASLVWEDVMLTAAHCHSEDPFRRLMVLGGHTQLGRGLVRNVVAQVPHPFFSSVMTNQHRIGLLDYDFMVLKLNESAPLANTDTAVMKEQPQKQAATPWNIERIKLNKNSSWPMAGQSLTVMGFGRTSLFTTDLSDRLRHVEISALANETCSNLYDGVAKFSPATMFCAAGSDGGDSCQGDSGGAVIDTATGVQVGVVSFGEGCGDIKFPGVYARVSTVYPWIVEQVCRLSCNPPPSCDPDLLHPCARYSGFMKNGPVSLQVQVQHDRFPSETAWLLEHVETQTELYFQPFYSQEDDVLGSISGASSSSSSSATLLVTKTFPKIRSGTYHFAIRDIGLDGICCLFGDGHVTITDLHTNQAVLHIDGGFTMGGDMYLRFDNQGTLLWVSSNPDGAYDDPNAGAYNVAVDDMQWPGQFPPAGMLQAMTINIRHDLYPTETTWTLTKLTRMISGNLEFVTVDAYRAGASMKGEIYSALKSNLEANTLYHFQLQDSQSDGICCSEENGRGWVTLTNSTASASDPRGTVFWQSPTNFTNVANVFLLVNANRHIDVITQAEADAYITSGGTTTQTGSANTPSQNETSGFHSVDLNVSTEDLWLVVEIEYDDIPAENTWALADALSGQELVRASGVDSNPATKNTTIVKGLGPSIYSFDIWDKSHDGICCAYGEGSFRLKEGSTGNVLFQSDGKFYGHLSVSVPLGVSAADLLSIPP